MLIPNEGAVTKAVLWENKLEYDQASDQAEIFFVQKKEYFARPNMKPSDDMREYEQQQAAEQRYSM